LLNRAEENLKNREKLKNWGNKKKKFETLLQEHPNNWGKKISNKFTLKMNQRLL
jgi:hypothetical protein